MTLPVLEAMRASFAYDPATGILTRTACRQRRLVGKPCGYSNRGYLTVRWSGKLYQLHRVCWLLAHGAWPAGHIDHINGNRSDNRLANLRDVPQAVNNENVRRAKSSNQAGALGVYPAPQPGRFIAQIKVAGKSRHLGTFSSVEQAHEA